MDRFDVLRKSISAALMILVLGLLYLQIFAYQRFKRLSQDNSIRTLYLDIPRGKILDRNGSVLAEDKLGFNLAFVPFDLDNDCEKYAELLSPILGMSRAEVRKKMSEKFANPFEPHILFHGLSQEQIHQIEEDLHQLKGAYIQAGLIRYYPLGMMAASIIGYLGEVNREEMPVLKNEGVRSGDLIGRSGIEKMFDSLLRGQRGGTQVEVNARGQQLRILGQKESKPGHTIVLTIDGRLQKAAFERFGERSGAVVVLSPSTGEVLALVSKPTYDPSNPAPYLFRPDKPFLNRALAGFYAPGSVFKIITSIAAFETGAVTSQDEYECTGLLTFGDREFHCWKEEGHGWVSFKEALTQSCNVYFGQIGIQAGETKLLEYAAKAGLGVVTGIDLPGEKAGFVPRPGESGGALNLSIGQGALLVTPIQMVNLIATVANGGNIMRPEVVREISSPEGIKIEEFGPSLRSYFFVSEPTMSLLKEGLTAVVASGTGASAAVPGITVAGKTGTAQTASRDLSMPTRGSFVCYAPAEQPQVAMAVVLDSGASPEAAAISGQVLRDYFFPPREEITPDTKTNAKSNSSFPYVLNGNLNP
ncbi:MAG: penicillin-binding protein 2 [Candidatus Omnitrophota bacterium]